MSTPTPKWFAHIVATLCILSGAGAAEIQFKTIALKGQPADGVGGPFTFSSFYRPVLAPSGLVAFNAQASGGTFPTGIWAGTSAPVDIVAQRGQPAPGANGLTYSSNFSDPVITVDGEIIFSGSLNEDTNARGIWFHSGHSTTYLSVRGQPATGNSPGVVFDAPFNLTPVGNSVAFTSRVAGPGISFGVNDEGIWAGRPGSLTLVAQNGGQAPGVPSDLRYSKLSYLQGNYAGILAFNATLANLNQPVTEGIFAGIPGAVSFVAQYGSPVMGLSNVTYAAFSQASLAPNTDHLGFSSRFAGSVTGENWTAILAGRPGSISVVARQGDAAPGTEAGVRFGLFLLHTITSAPVVADEGQVAFLAPLTGPNVDTTTDMGIWAGLSGSLELVAREGYQAPGLPEGVVFDTLEKPFINPLGQIAFRATIDGLGVSFGNEQGLWATDPTGNLLLVARLGDSLGGSDLGPITALTLGRNVPNDGSETIFNADGLLTFSAAFQNNTYGIFVADSRTNDSRFVGVGIGGLAKLLAQTESTLLGIAGD